MFLGAFRSVLLVALGLAETDNIGRVHCYLTREQAVDHQEEFGQRTPGRPHICVVVVKLHGSVAIIVQHPH
jgi:hypothetical protein